MDNLLNFIFRASSVTPSYRKEHCIAYKQSMSICSTCRDVCPHDAISFRRGKTVEIDDIDCTGCGLCVANCPSQALETKVRFQSGAPLKCSQVKGGAQSIQCHTKLSPSDILRLAGKKNKVTLVRQACETCKIGSEAVPETVERTFAKAAELAALRQRDIKLETLVEERYDTTDNPDTISRRELLRGGFRNLQESAAEALAPLDFGDDEDTSLPLEMQRQYYLLKRSNPQPDDLVPWILPEVADGCIMCPVCTNVCPTKAFGRDFDPEGLEGSILKLDPERCNGCEACTGACPVKVISMKSPVTWDEAKPGEKIAYHKKPDDEIKKSVSR